MSANRVHSLEGIFVKSEFMETLMSINLMGWNSPGFSGTYRNRNQFEKVYIKCGLARTLERIYNVEQWPGW